MKKNVAEGIAVVGIGALVAGAAGCRVHSLQQEGGEEPSGVFVKYTAMYGEDESANNHSFAVIQGTVEKISKIALPNGAGVKYRSIVTVQVEQVYQGDVSKDTVSILMPDAANEKDTKSCPVANSMKVGRQGIFIAERLDKADYEEDVDGSRIYLKELAEYGIFDAEKSVFIKTEEGMAYSKEAYQDLPETATMKEAGEYLEQKLKKKE